LSNKQNGAVTLHTGALGPVNTKDAGANAVIGAQGKARGTAKAYPPWRDVQRLAGGLSRLRFAPCSRPFEEQRIWHL